MAYAIDHDDRLPVPGIRSIGTNALGQIQTHSVQWNPSQHSFAYVATNPDAIDEPKRRWEVSNLGYLHLSKTIKSVEVLYCPSAPKGWRYEDYAERYSWPFDPKLTHSTAGGQYIEVSYAYTPQSTHCVKLRNDAYAYEAAFKLSTLNNRAALALDWVDLKDDNPRNMHQGTGGRVAGGNILYGDGSVRFRPIQENEKEYWEENKSLNRQWLFRGLLYMFAQ